MDIQVEESGGSVSSAGRRNGNNPLLADDGSKKKSKHRCEKVRRHQDEDETGGASFRYPCIGEFDQMQKNA
jgi:hypothetical protein